MFRSLMLVLFTTLVVLAAPAVHAAKKPHPPHRPHTPHHACKADGKRCKDDSQCCGGGCCDGKCSSDPACCRSGEVACNGTCCNTLAGDACCALPLGGIGCIDTTQDRFNCGGCGAACPVGQQCDFGSCVCPEERPTLCNDECIDTRADPDNCGACGNRCQDGEVCDNGTCQGCGPCEERVGGVCVPKHCGCGACDPATGECTSNCGPGESCCNDQCVPLFPTLPGDDNPPGNCCEFQGQTTLDCGTNFLCAGRTCCDARTSKVCVGTKPTDPSFECCALENECVQHQGATMGGWPACCAPHALLPAYCCDTNPRDGCLPQICCHD